MLCTVQIGLRKRRGNSRLTENRVTLKYYTREMIHRSVQVILITKLNLLQ